MNRTTHETRPTAGSAVPPPRTTVRSRVRLLWLALAVAAFVAACGLAATAGVVNHVDGQHRDGGFMTTDTTHVSSAGHAVIFDEIDLDGLSGDWLLGSARLRATSEDSGKPVFVGLASSADVETYLRGTGYSRIDEISDDGVATYDEHAGGAPTSAPGDSDMWIASEVGAGTQTVEWEPEDGSWTVVVMNQDASSGVDAEADIGATLPVLHDAVRWLVIGSVASGAVGALALLLFLGNRRRAGQH
jgi:hypothetical protein